MPIVGPVQLLAVVFLQNLAGVGVAEGTGCRAHDASYLHRPARQAQEQEQEHGEVQDCMGKDSQLRTHARTHERYETISRLGSY